MTGAPEALIADRYDWQLGNKSLVSVLFLALFVVGIPFTGNMDFFSLMGPPAYYTPIGLGASRGAPHQNQHLSRSPLFVRGRSR
jgi:hypothetical protein